MNLDRLVCKDNHILSYNDILLNGLSFLEDCEMPTTYSGIDVTGIAISGEPSPSTKDLVRFFLFMSAKKMDVVTVRNHIKVL